MTYIYFEVNMDSARPNYSPDILSEQPQLCSDISNLFQTSSILQFPLLNFSVSRVLYALPENLNPLESISSVSLVLNASKRSATCSYVIACFNTINLVQTSSKQ